jgi:hypothetical protein
MQNATSGYSNLGIGDFALNGLIDGVENICIGDSCAANLTSGGQNIIIGAYINASSPSITDEIRIGYSSGYILSGRLHATSDTDVSAGLILTAGNALPNATGANINGGPLTLKGGNGAANSVGVANGGNLILSGGTGYGIGTSGSINVNSPMVLSTAAYNISFDGDVIIGLEAGLNMSSANSSVAIGWKALKTNVSGRNTSVGDSSLELCGNTQTGNSAFGYKALQGCDDSSFNSAFGEEAGGQLYNAGDINNAFFGYKAGQTMGGSSPDNAVFGAFAGQGGVSTARTAYFGAHSGKAAGGNDNTGVGYNALLLNTGDNNTVLGSGAGDAITSGSDNIVIGKDVDVSGATVVHEIAIGDVISGNMGALTDIDVSAQTLTIQGPAALSSAVTNLDGGTLTIKGGDGASGSVGDADGGNLILSGGTGYGTGADGIVTTTSDLDVTGNIIVSGTVDGRDMVTDGNKLDAITAGAIAELVEDTSPQLGGMLDVNGNGFGDGTLELLLFSETVSAVNEFTIANAATGNGPTLSSTGGDAVIDMNFAAKSTGAINIGTASNLVGFFGTAAVDQAAALTANLTTLTQAGTFTPDYAIQAMTNTSPYGFATLDEAETVLSVILNLQARVAELEAALDASTGVGIIA